MKFKRSSGIILHPTSLPGPHGIGELGPEAHRWINFLSQAGCALWQVLPLGPTGYGDSPYQCFSAFAGNPYLISLDKLVDEKLLEPADLADRPAFPTDHVDYWPVICWKLSVLDKAYENFKHINSKKLQQEYEAFQAQQAFWLNDFAVFMALKDVHNGAPWHTWETPLRQRQPQALAAVQQEHARSIERQVFLQFLFFRQWAEVHEHARQEGIRIIGDIPIFVAHDSADVWANPGLFYLDKAGQPTIVAGVPPDYFSPTGQLWGNPLYRWDVHKANGYEWWLRRIRSVLEMVDIVRIDHFRGFAAYWEVPGDAPTAQTGRWVPGPGKHFFEAVRSALGDLPIIAEDLGVVTPDVSDLRDSMGLPGMKIVQFAFSGDPADPFLPHNYSEHCVVYTGTHDNDTARGWYERINDVEKDFYRRYLARDGHDVSWDMIRAAWSSVAVLALAPIQDFLSLGNEARMNYPGNPSGNWQWRMPAETISELLRNRIKETNYIYRRDKDTVEIVKVESYDNF